MIILLLFAFLSGLVTIFAPCIWPLLPIILSASSSGGHKKPLGITLGIMISFAVFTLTISYIVSIFRFDPTVLRYVAVVVISFLGLTLIIPALSAKIEGYVSRLSGRFNKNTTDDGFKGGLLTGLSLGIVWTPCAGPILATIATLAATQAVNLQIVLVTITYVIGIGIPLFMFALAGQHLFTKSKFFNKYTGRLQQIFGVIMILTALSIATNYDRVLQARLLNAFPSYSEFLTKLETNETVKKQLDTIRKRDGSLINDNFGAAPEFAGISTWLNTEGKPLTMAELKGKVVLIDFWTYTCINCIRTLPYITSWYEKYKDQGFVVVGVHTPEFEFEKVTANVEHALKQYDITYPVAQDNDYETWDAYRNQYWPAHYVIDANGVIRYTHFGEGEYETTEKNIQDLLKEAGKNVDGSMVSVKTDVPQFQTTPETYLGLARLERTTNSSLIPLHYIAFKGNWDHQAEYSAAGKDAELYLHFEGTKVYLVITPQKAGHKVKVQLDGKPISDDLSGKDVKDGQITLDEPRLYEIVDFKGSTKEGLLKLLFPDSGTKVFAFTFG